MFGWLWGWLKGWDIRPEVLGVMADGKPRTGFEIGRAIELKAGRIIGYGTLYRALDRLIMSGDLARWKDDATDPPRFWYRRLSP